MPKENQQPFKGNEIKDAGNQKLNGRFRSYEILSIIINYIKMEIEGHN